MSKWLKQFLFGIWGLLLIPLITPILEKWLEENVFSDPNGTATTVFPNAMATTVFNNLLALGQQRWFKFAFVFLTGIIIGVSIEWVEPEVGRKKSFRTPKPRLQISQSFRQHQSSDRVVRMAGQCTRS